MAVTTVAVTRVVGRGLVALAVVVACSVLLAAPAGADPARPTNYRSVMTSMRPATPYVTLRVVGGDGFLDLSVERGHTAVIDGYAGEPYVRVLADGTVEINHNSPAFYLNKSAYGTTAPPPDLDGPTLPPPLWKVKGHHGRYVWHDHRIHFMGRHPIGELAHGRPVYWTVDLQVDGATHVAEGNYRLLRGPNTLIWLGLIALVVGIVVVAGRRRPVLVAAVATLVAAPIGLVLGWNQDKVVPKAAGGSPLIVILPVLALLASLVALWRWKEPRGVVAVLAAVALEGGWFLSRTSVLWKTVIPTRLPAGIDRTGSAILIALAVGAARLAVHSGGLARPRPPGRSDPAAPSDIATAAADAQEAASPSGR